MALYRAFLVDPNGRYHRSTWFHAGDDAAALTMAMTFAGSEPFELWIKSEFTPPGGASTDPARWAPVRPSAGAEPDGNGQGSPEA